MSPNSTARAQAFRVAAIASFLSAATTAVLIYGPGAEAGGDLAQQAAQHNDWSYLYKRWVLFFHPQFAFIAAAGAGLALFAKRPVLVALSLFYLLIWCVTEVTQQALVIDALNQYWRPGLLNAASDEERDAYATLIRGFSGLSDSYYFVLLFGFGIGTTLLGIAFLRDGSWGNAIGTAQIFIGALSLTAFAGYYLGLAAVTPITGWLYSNVYGVVQTGVRVAVGVWLWRQVAGHTSS